MTIRCLGDSITFGQYLPLGTAAWPERMGAVGRGVCNETTRQALERFPTELRDPADVTVLQWGHNDANRWDGVNRVSLGGYRENLHEMIHRCHVVGTLPVLCTLYETLKSPLYNFDLARYDEEVRRVAEVSKTRLAYVGEAFQRVPLEQVLMPDGIHLNESGHELYARTVRAAL